MRISGILNFPSILEEINVECMFIIAEIAQAHEGKIELAHKYIDELGKTGVNAVKFQVHIAEAESSEFEPFRIKMLGPDKSRFDYWKRMEFSLEEWKELKLHCDEVGVEFLASPFSNAAVDLLEQLKVKRYKAGSGEVSNFLILKKICNTGKPIILSSGMSSFEELDSTVDFLKEQKAKFSILQCTTSYPTRPENYGLNVIQELKERYNVPIGFSDHSAKIGTCIAAASLGAEIIEFHAVLDRNSNGPDATSSLEMDEIKELVQAVINIEIALENPIDKSDNSDFKELKNIFEKSLAVNKDLKKGHFLKFADLEAKKPKGYGINARDFENVIGKKIKKNLTKWDFLKETDLDLN